MEKLDPKEAGRIREAKRKLAEKWAKELPTREQRLKKQAEEREKEINKADLGREKNQRNKNKPQNRKLNN